MDDLIKEYMRSLDTNTIDCFRVLLHEASRQQLELISKRYEVAVGLNKQCIDDEGVQANMIKWLGEELVLISLYHTFEIKLKEIKKYKNVMDGVREQDGGENLYRWDLLKKTIPRGLRKTNDYMNVNTLRVLVNCLKHAGVVSKDLNKINPSFGEVGCDISVDLNELYDVYKESASRLIIKTCDELF